MLVLSLHRKSIADTDQCSIYVCCVSFRAKFLRQLKQLVEQRDAIMADTTLRTHERKQKLADLTMPREENLPGVHLEDLRSEKLCGKCHLVGK